MQWVIRTERLGLRRLAAADQANLEGMPWLDAERILSRTLDDYQRVGYGFWGVILPEVGEFAGICGLLPQTVEGRQEIEVAYHLIEAFHGRGFGTEAARGVMDYAVRVLGIRRLVSLIEPRNTASINVARKNGLRYERDARLRGIPVQVFAAVDNGGESA
jgi:ribosomal-protein-alanine N-acetyltransferase